jgi:pimeloyl-ACP methyl ester carboxylesterase
MNRKSISGFTIISSIVVILASLLAGNFTQVLATQSKNSIIYHPLPDCGNVFPTTSNRRLLILLQGLGSNTDLDPSSNRLSGLSGIQKSVKNWEEVITGGTSGQPGIGSLYGGILYFSYSPTDSINYHKEDSWKEIRDNVQILHDTIELCHSQGWESFDLVGHSMGGVVASEYGSLFALNSEQGNWVKHIVPLDSPVNGSLWSRCLNAGGGACLLIPNYVTYIPLIPEAFKGTPAAIDIGGMALDQKRTENLNLATAKYLFNKHGILYRSLKNNDSLLIRNSDAGVGLIMTLTGDGAFSKGFDLGMSINDSHGDKDIGHGRIVSDAELYPDFLRYLHYTLCGGPVGTSNNVCTGTVPEPPGNPTPLPPPPTPDSDLASFIADISLPDGIILTPNQLVTKTWRLKNTGHSTWGTGYKLVFVDGEQMGAPKETNISATAPGATVDLSVPLIAPTGNGEHTGYFQLRNPQGAYFGPRIWVKINVSTPSSKITLFSADPASPANTSQVRFHAKAEGVNNLRAMRLLVDGVGKYETGASEFFYNWDTAGYSAGSHNIVVEVADWSDLSWSRPQRKSLTYTLIGNATVNNHAPNPPTLTSPYDWYVYYSGNTAQLCAQANGDPDSGDSVTGYYFDVYESAQLWNSGWTASNCVTTAGMSPYDYKWRVKVRDSHNAESDWSPSWHYTLVNQSLSISELYFQPQDGDSEVVKIRTCTTGQAGIGITMRVSVNTANDGSGNGTWNIIKEQGSPCFNDNDAPVWRTLDYSDGTHRVRSEAHGLQSGWNGAAVREETYTLPHRRPSDVRLVAPVPQSKDIREAIFVNSRTVSFKWEASLRVTNYTLSVSTGPNPQADPNPVFRQTFGSGTTEYTVNFSQDYPTLYWQVVASNDKGSTGSGDQLFGMDRTAPTCAIQPLAAVSYENNFQVHWSGADAVAGIAGYNVQYKDSRDEVWSDWMTAVPAAKVYDLFIGQAGHTYSFRCQATDNAGNTGVYPVNGDTSIKIDPAARPQEVWALPGYALKRNITIQNNMPDAGLPANYPVNVQFTTGTSPSAAEVYNASQSAIKCDDLRILYNNTTQLNRYIKKCAPDGIDIWFRSNAVIAAGATNTLYQMYLGNSAASNPPADPAQIWYPSRESDTANLYLFQEGSGSIAYDYSGNGRNCTINPSVNWATAKWGSGLHFSRFNNGNTISLTCGSPYPISALTAEFWWKSDVNYNNTDGRLAGQLGPSNQLSWLVSVESDRMKFERWCNGGSQQARGNINIRQLPYYGQWNYLAVTFDGGNQVKFYINGSLDNAVTLDNSCSATYNIPLEIGSVEGGGQGEYTIGAFRLSNSVKTDFYPGTFANIKNEPSFAVGTAILPPATGTPDLAVQSLNAYPNPSGGILVETVIQNQGTLSTTNGFFTDLYVNHMPTGAGDYTGSLQVWVNDPIPAGGSVTLTTVVSSLPGAASALAAGISETTGTLYTQTDSTGALNETTKSNNISGALEVCVATPDLFEVDDTPAQASTLALRVAQARNFDKLGDADWAKFSAVQGKNYTISTSNLGPAADTYLYLYGTDGVTLLASNDDFGAALASQIQWKAPATGTYYVLVKHWNPNVAGCGTTYTLNLAQFFTLFTPSVAKSGPAVVTYKIAGQVLDAQQNPIEGVTVSVGATSTTTNSMGFYTLLGLSANTYTVTPSKTGYTFAPTTRQVTVGPDAAGQDFTATPITTCIALPGNAVAWWKAESSPADAIGTSGGILQNQAGYASGKVGQAFNLDGVDDWVRLSHTAALHPTGSFSIEAWVYPTWTAQDPAAHVILSKWGDSGSWTGMREYGLLAIGTQVQFAISDAAHQSDYSFHNFRSVEGAITLNAWNHVVATYDVTTGTRKIYVNGQEKGTRTDAPITITNGIADAGIGNRAGGPSILGQEYFAGKIDEIVFYSRALTLADALAGYNAGSGGHCPYMISGTIKNASNTPMTNVIVTVGGLSMTTTTDTNGNYTLAGLPANTYTVTPSKIGYTFNPTSRSVTVGPNATGQDFVGSLAVWEESFSAPSPITQFKTIMSYNGKLYAGGMGASQTTGGRLFVFDGTTWLDANFYPAGATVDMIETMAVFDGKLFIGTRVNVSGSILARVYSYDGTTFTAELSAPGKGGYSGIESLAVHNAGLYAADGATGYGKVYQRQANGTWVSLGGQVESGAAARALASYGGELYAGTSFGATGAGLFKWNGTTWSLVADLATIYPGRVGIRRLAAYSNSLFVGFANGTAPGPVPAFNGSTWQISYSIPSATGIEIMASGNRLWAGGGQKHVYTFNGSKWDDLGPLAFSPIDFAVYQGYVYAATSGGGKIYRYNLAALQN